MINLTLEELIDELNEIEDKSKEVYIHNSDGYLTTFIKVREYVEGIILREKSQ